MNKCKFFFNKTLIFEKSLYTGQLEDFLSGYCVGGNETQNFGRQVVCRVKSSVFIYVL